MIMVPISVGELFDKISILKIKSRKIKDQDKLSNVLSELRILEELSEGHKSIITDELDFVNQNLWDIEEKIREKERHLEFDDEFIQLARNVYINNDRRSQIKREINLQTNSSIIEEKSY